MDQLKAHCNRSYAFFAMHHFDLSGQIWGVSHCFLMCAMQYIHHQEHLEWRSRCSVEMKNMETHCICRMAQM